MARLVLIQRCHVEQSETSLAYFLEEQSKTRSEILRSAQNDMIDVLCVSLASSPFAALPCDQIVG
jgi:hypothetical protein